MNIPGFPPVCYLNRWLKLRMYHKIVISIKLISNHICNGHWIHLRSTSTFHASRKTRYPLLIRTERRKESNSFYSNYHHMTMSPGRFYIYNHAFQFGRIALAYSSWQWAVTTLFFRYCKGITEIEENELRLFAAKRKQESLGKGTVVKFLSKNILAGNSTENNQSHEQHNGQLKNGRASLVSAAKSNSLSGSSCTEVNQRLRYTKMHLVSVDIIN